MISADLIEGKDVVNQEGNYNSEREGIFGWCAQKRKHRGNREFEKYRGVTGWTRWTVSD